MHDITLLTAKETARRLSIGTATLWRWARTGHMPAPIKIAPRTTRWRAADVEHFIAQRAGDKGAR